jgi:hypothetical protein
VSANQLELLEQVYGRLIEIRTSTLADSRLGQVAVLLRVRHRATVVEHSYNQDLLDFVPLFLVL